jgi:hypothetical protein
MFTYWQKENYNSHFDLLMAVIHVNHSTSLKWSLLRVFHAFQDVRNSLQLLVLTKSLGTSFRVDIRLYHFLHLHLISRHLTTINASLGYYNMREWLP